METVFIEYSNQHDQRKYPFLDDASMASINGTLLTTGCIRDIFFYPLDGTGPFYVKTLAVVAGYMELAEVATGTVIARADWTTGDTDVPIYEVGGYARQIGIVVFGNEINQGTGEAIMVFEAEATTLVGACAVPLLQVGVRGLLCDDQFMTGVISIIGKNGVNVSTFIEPVTNKSILRIDAVGEPPPPDETCDAGPPIETIHLINEACSAMIASGSNDGDIYLMGRPGWTALDNCPPKMLPDNNGVLPMQHDTPCEEPVPPVPPPCGPASAYVVPVTNGQLKISAPSTLGGDNPFKVTTEDTDGEQFDLTLFKEPTSIEVLERRRRNMFDNMLPPGQVVISLRGRLQ